jgi:hypothetical protein
MGEQPRGCALQGATMDRERRHGSPLRLNARDEGGAAGACGRSEPRRSGGAVEGNSARVAEDWF